MTIVEQSVSAGGREVFELGEFLSRPLYAHLAHNSDQGPRESPVWFHWDGQAIWIIGGDQSYKPTRWARQEGLRQPDAEANPAT